MSISPLGGWLIVSGQFYFTINREEIFYFCNKKMPYLCGFWRFANAYIKYRKRGTVQWQERKLLQATGK
jgi:hypothetical protein